MKIPRILFIPLLVAMAALVSFIVCLITNLLGGEGSVTMGVFTFLGLMGSFILFIWGRQLWWFISGTGDYQGRVGLLKKLWIKIFKK